MRERPLPRGQWVASTGEGLTPGWAGSEEGVPQSSTLTKSEKEEIVPLLGFHAPFLLKKTILL